MRLRPKLLEHSPRIDRVVLSMHYTRVYAHHIYISHATRTRSYDIRRDIEMKLQKRCRTNKLASRSRTSNVIGKNAFRRNFFLFYKNSL